MKLLPLIAGLVVATAAGSPRLAADKPAPFDLEARKRQQSWVWTTPTRQPIPSVGNPGWPLDPVDAFVLQRLEKAGLAPAPAADDRTWLRRVHFAITGLPPDPGAVRAFVADTAPGARERVVDALLASPHAGERWARHWMDLMRYAESRGHEGDYIIANAWRYRDYLIRAFNEDVPYDQFLSEHLAGDLLPVPRMRPGTEINESVLATGWAFFGEENHSPVDIRQDECERIDNKVDVFGKTFLGLTVSCARCHDHKFDPIRSQDYYALSGFMLGSSFRQVRFEAMENNRRKGAELAALRRRHFPGIVRAVVESRAPGIQRIADHLVAARDVLASGATNPAAIGGHAGRAGLDAGRLGRWVAELRDATSHPGHPLHGFATFGSDHAPAGAAVSAEPVLPAGARVIADFTKPGKQPWKTDGEAFGPGPVVAGDIVPGTDAANPVARVMTYGAARRDPFWNRLKTASGNENDSGRLAAVARAGRMLRTPTVTLGVGKLHYLVRGKAHVYAAVDSHIMLEGPLHGQLTRGIDGGMGDGPRWVTHDLAAYGGHRAHVEFGPDGDNELEVLMVVESAEVPAWVPARAPFVASPAARTARQFAGEFQAAVGAACEALRRGNLAESKDAAGQAALADWVVRNPALFGGALDAAGQRDADGYFAGQARIASEVTWESHTAVAWFDGTGVDENVLVRGKPFKPGELAPRSLPVAFSGARPIETRESSGRRELARQLVDPSNPLVARTIVNRVWHHLFGRGIVATVDNFGALGDRPSHPELLDHLAWQFVHEDGWSVKRLIRRLVLTRTYAMSSRAGDARVEEADPSNVLLHRMPVRRLEAEVIRDALLAVSGRLDPTVGGPPELVHLTDFIVGRGRPDKSGPLDGDGRRSIYVAVRRNFLPTLMQTFDSPTPFSTVGKRNVTNVPGQALALMNDPLFHQQAGVWAARMLRETRGARDEDRIRWLFESAYGREPGPAEIRACAETVAELRSMDDPKDTAGAGAWGELCHALLNANDFIYVK